MESFKKLLRTKKYYTHAINNAVSAISIQKNGDERPRIIGSTSYKCPNTSDIDVFEYIKRHNKIDLIKFFINGINTILDNDDCMIFLEVKCGLDHLYYDVDIGYCVNDTYVIPNDFDKVVDEFYQKKILDKDEYNIIKSILEYIPKKQIDFELVKKIFRNRYILRWTKNDIKHGFKKLINRSGKFYMYTLSDAVQEKTKINIEYIFTRDDQYVEISNFFVLSYLDKNNRNEHLLNLSDDVLKDPQKYREDDLKISIYTLLNSAIDKNIFKSIKRMLSFARCTKNIELISKVYPLINSELGILYSLNSQLKTIIKVLKSSNIDNTLYNHLDNIRFKMQDLIFLDLPVDFICESITEIIEYKYITVDEIYNRIDLITKNISNYINDCSLKKLITCGLYPINNYMMPEIKPF